MAWLWHAHEDADVLHVAVAAALREAIERRLGAQAVLSLAGGSTPLPAYRLLAQAKLPWPRVTLVPGDERCVPHAHDACNLRQLGACFTGTGAIAQPLTTVDGDPEMSLALATRWLDAHPQPFAATVLGIGADGHTASLFPGAANLAAGLDLAGGDAVIRVVPQPLPPEAPFERISMTAPRLLHSDAIHLLATGDGKRSVLEQAMGNPARYPVGAVLHAPGRTVHVHWSP